MACPLSFASGQKLTSAFVSRVVRKALNAGSVHHFIIIHSCPPGLCWGKDILCVRR